MRSVLSTRVVASTVGLLVSGLAGVAPAAYVQTTQDRTLTASTSATATTPVADPNTETSTALGSFDRSFTSTSRSPRLNFPGEFATATASASQTVNFGGSSIDGVFHVSAFTGSLSALETATSTVSSRWQTRFTVDTPTPFNLSGNMQLSSGGLGSVGTSSVSFAFSGTGPDENFFGTGGPQAADLPIAASGVLQPGSVYTLSATLDGQKSGDSFSKDINGTINFTLALPEPSSAAALLTAAAVAGLRRRPA